MKITYYLEVLSSWCYWSEAAWADLKVRYGSRVEFQWKIALMSPSDFPVSRSQCDWFYRRSGMVMRSPFMLNSGWFEAERQGIYDTPNLVAEAGKDFGVEDDRLRLALAGAAVRDGRKIGNLDEAVAVATEATAIDARKLKDRALSTEVRDRVIASTAEFHAHKITQRPAYVVENNIGDKAVFSGLANAAPLIATIDAMLGDAAAYSAHLAHFGATPPN